MLSPQFLKQLESYYDKAGIQDKAKCLELITSVKLGQELRQQVKATPRPKTAMPAFGYTDTSNLSPYKTHYTKEYPPKLDEGVTAIRPQTSDGYATQVPNFEHPGGTIYEGTYYNKQFQRPATPERAGSSSGNRNNRPHPAKAFMVWQFPRKNRYHKEPEHVDASLTNQKLNEITKRLCSSVYQNDYLGIPQGFQVKSAFRLPSDWKDNVPYGMESNQRETYQQPYQQPELVVPTTRYGANTKKPLASVAVVPTANRRLFGVNKRTTYDRHFNDNATMNVEQIRDVGRKLGAEALLKHYQQNTGGDKDLIGNLLNEYGGPPSPSAPYASMTPVPPPCYSPQRAPSQCRSAAMSRARTPGLGGYGRPVQRAPSGLAYQRAGSVASGRAPSAASRASTPAFRPRPTVPGNTAILLPDQPPMEVQMPTTPLSVAYTPPLFLSS